MSHSSTDPGDIPDNLVHCNEPPLPNPPPSHPPFPNPGPDTPLFITAPPGPIPAIRHTGGQSKNRCPGRGLEFTAGNPPLTHRIALNPAINRRIFGPENNSAPGQGLPGRKGQSGPDTASVWGVRRYNPVQGKYRGFYCTGRITRSRGGALLSVPTINEHVINIYDTGELPHEATIRKFRTVQAEGEGTLPGTLTTTASMPSSRAGTGGTCPKREEHISCRVSIPVRRYSYTGNCRRKKSERAYDSSGQTSCTRTGRSTAQAHQEVWPDKNTGPGTVRSRHCRPGY